jgi:hypothetical protein
MLTLQQLNTEAFARLWQFRETFDEEFKTTFGSMSFLVDDVTKSGAERAREISEHIASFWHNRFSDDQVVRRLKASTETASMLGILQVHSAADQYLDDVAGDLQRWHDFRDKEWRRPSLAENAEPIGNFSKGLTVRQPHAHVSAPLLAYFRALRNCIAHRSGRASRHLARCLQDGAARAALTQLSKDPEHPRLPSLPEQVVIGEAVSVEPRIAILCLDVVTEACRALDQQIVQELGDEGIIYLAAHHCLLKTDPIETNATTSAGAAVNDYLHTRCRAHSISADQTISVLKGLGVWDRCRSAWNMRQT